MNRRMFLKSLSGAGLCAGAALTGGCHYYYIIKGELASTNEMFIEPFRRRTFLSWNINAGLGMDGTRDLARIAEVIKKADVAVTAVQEVDRKTTRVKGVDQLEELEKLTGLRGLWCATSTREKGEVGMALLVKDMPAKDRIAELPGGGKVLLAEYPAFTAGVLHLPAKEEDREAVVVKLSGLIEVNRPLFLLGDWGEDPTTELMQKLRRAFATLTNFAKTYPADEPTNCYDYIAISQRHRMRFEHISHEVIEEKVASDHRPVKVTAW